MSSADPSTPKTGYTPTGDYWDMLVRETWASYIAGNLTGRQATERFHHLVLLREQHDTQVARATDEREPQLDQLINEREGRR